MGQEEQGGRQLRPRGQVSKTHTSGDSEGAPACHTECALYNKMVTPPPQLPPNLILNQVTTSLREQESTAVPRTPKSTELLTHKNVSATSPSAPVPSWAV